MLLVLQGHLVLREILVRQDSLAPPALPGTKVRLALLAIRVRLVRLVLQGSQGQQVLQGQQELQEKLDQLETPGQPVLRVLRGQLVQQD